MSFLVSFYLLRLYSLPNQFIGPDTAITLSQMGYKVNFSMLRNSYIMHSPITHSACAYPRSSKADSLIDLPYNGTRQVDMLCGANWIMPKQQIKCKIKNTPEAPTFCKFFVR